MIKNFLNPEGHQNPIIGSKVTAILLRGGYLPIGGASAREGLLLQPAQQACLCTTLLKNMIFHNFFVYPKFFYEYTAVPV